MRNITLDTDADGIALIAWDMPGRSMNVLSAESIADYAEAVERVLADPAITGAVVTSRKAAFLAGADLPWLERLMRTEEPEPARARAIFDALMRMQDLLRRIETGKKPFVAAINGTALGGGFELCLACHRRIVADDPKLRVGLPEAKVGLLPGAGGTQRTLRMLGRKVALPLLLEGRALAPAKARELGLVDEVVPPEQVVEAARAWVRNAPADLTKPWDRPGFVLPGGDPRGLAAGQLLAVANALQRKRTQGNYPQLDAIQQLVHDGALLPMDTALRLEVKALTAVMLRPPAAAMVRTNFVNLQRAGRLPHRPAAEPKRDLRRIGVLGAGFMGAGIAHVAAQAGMEVVLLDRDEPTARRALDGISRRLTDPAALARIHPTAEYAELAGASLVIEAVFEERALKAEVTRRAEAMLGEDAVFASNTSTLPIAGLAEASARPERFLGLHFFSPVDRMALVEVIRGPRTGPAALATGLDFVQRLRKTPIVVNDSRGFYTSRVVGTYLGEGVAMLEDGVAPALIENAGRAAGMAAPPLALCDEVALDLIRRVHLQTARDLGAAWQEDAYARVIHRLVEQEGRIGRKGGGGFYDYPAEGPKRLWPGLARLAPPAAAQPNVTEAKQRLLAIQALEAARCLHEGILIEAGDADLGAVLGWGFAPWTGGPLSWVDMQGSAAFVVLCDGLADRHGERFRPHQALRRMAAEGAAFYQPASQAA